MVIVIGEGNYGPCRHLYLVKETEKAKYCVEEIVPNLELKRTKSFAYSYYEHFLTFLVCMVIFY